MAMVMIPKHPPHPDWILPQPRPFRWWLLLLIPIAPVAGDLLPIQMSGLLLLFVLVVFLYSARV